MSSQLKSILHRSLLIAALGFAIAASAQENKEQTPPAKRVPGKLPPGVRALRNIEYVPGGHERQKLDLYLPEKGGPWPLVVWVHGGSWKAGSKDGTPAVMLTSQGYAVASINYRLSQHAVWPAQIEDCKTAIRWLRAHADQYHYDANHIGAWGASAGGHLVSLLGTLGETKAFDKGENLQYSSQVQAVCDWFGPADFTKWVEGSHPPLDQLFGAKMNRDHAVNASPVTYISAKTPPFLIMQGTKDPLVPMDQSVDFEAALKKAGVEAKLIKLEGAGHGGPQFNTPEMSEAIRSFFDRNLKAAGNRT